MEGDAPGVADARRRGRARGPRRATGRGSNRHGPAERRTTPCRASDEPRAPLEGVKWTGGESTGTSATEGARAHRPGPPRFDGDRGGLGGRSGADSHREPGGGPVRRRGGRAAIRGRPVPVVIEDSRPVGGRIQESGPAASAARGTRPARGGRCGSRSCGRGRPARAPRGNPRSPPTPPDAKLTARITRQPANHPLTARAAEPADRGMPLGDAAMPEPRPGGSSMAASEVRSSSIKS